ncbi:hypothetical protein [Cerasicoccus frondis]|uniref:hypothetical protein n=1 Tax=Cerasicoccus frondis TaxID=490090 RepID=UPI00285259C9|nr:hypothetical protein [Cerasicoccus frondis]
MKFQLGEVVITRNAAETLNLSDAYEALITRHAQEDWGDVCAEDAQLNEDGLTHGQRLMSVYTDAQGIKFWIITEWDRSVTTILLPEDY